MTGTASFSGRSVAQCCFGERLTIKCFTSAESLLPTRRAALSLRPTQKHHKCMRVMLARVAAETPVLPEATGSGRATVGDVMTSKRIFVAKEDTTIDEALEILVNNGVTGLPVLDEEQKVVGVVSDFDLLSLDHISGERQTSGIFPDISTDWAAFAAVEKLILKNHGRVVGDVMTADPFTVRTGTSLEDAARMLLDKRIRRLPVVDADGKLLGMFSRSDVIKAAVKTRSLVRQSVQE